MNLFRISAAISCLLIVCISCGCSGKQHPGYNQSVEFEFRQAGPVTAVVIVSIPLYARLTRSAVLSTREQDYVTASRALGESNRGLLRRRVIPNSITPLIVAGSLGIATAVLEVAALSFLGLGVPEPIPEWGAMIGRDFNSIFSRPLLVLAPAFMLTMLVLGFNLLGDGLRDALDPRLNR